MIHWDLAPSPGTVPGVCILHKNSYISPHHPRLAITTPPLCRHKTHHLQSKQYQHCQMQARVIKLLHNEISRIAPSDIHSAAVLQGGPLEPLTYCSYCRCNIVYELSVTAELSADFVQFSKTFLLNHKVNYKILS